MNPTIDDVLRKAVNAHKSGQLDEAGRLYDLILATHPKHPDANHNMGALAVGMGDADAAIPFLKTAMESSPNNVQYWVSYIDVLIRVGDLEKAAAILSQAREKGAKGNVFDQFESRVKNPDARPSVLNIIENFYKNSKITIVNNAAQGWVYSTLFDKDFLEKTPIISKKQVSSSKRDDNHKTTTENQKQSLNPGQVINDLNNEDYIVKKYEKLKGLLQNSDANLTHDSFGLDVTTDFLQAQKQAFENDALNIVIIGAGVTGLFLANTLKNTIGNDVNILLVDNRSNKQHTRRPFDRDWLTHIPAESVQKYTPENIKDLLDCFGKNGQIGLPINMLEALLMLSCKELGIQFYFAPEIGYSKLDSEKINFVFDATGGRLDGCEYPVSDYKDKELPLKSLVKEFQYTGIVPPGNKMASSPGDLDVTLKCGGSNHIPCIGSEKIKTYMVKVLGIKESLLNTVYAFIEPRNGSNQFFVWEGALKPEFNEGLIFVNLTKKEYDFLYDHIGKSARLEVFLDKVEEDISILNEDLRSFLKMLAELEHNDGIRLERPFSYSPYINMDAGSGNFNSLPIFPIGDAYFCGNPKVGNGLWTHIGFINELVGRISTACEK